MAAMLDCEKPCPNVPKPLLVSLTTSGLHVQNGRENVASRSQRTQVIFDGVLFNRRELKSQYPHETLDASDPDLVLDAYMRLGSEFINAIKGIFIVVIWDEEKRTGFCARD